MKIQTSIKFHIISMMAGLTDWNQGALDAGMNFHGYTYPIAKSNSGFKRNRRAQLKLSAKKAA